MDFLIPTLTDILDILIIAVILYCIFLVVKKTTAIEVISSVCFIFFLYLLANIFNLKMVLSILRSLQNNWVLVIIIVFQSELKNIVSQLSKSNNLISIFKSPIRITYSTILDAVREFSAKRTGALLVFEKNQKLDYYISTGEILNAELSTKLLLSIFDTSNIFHDGAAIIRNDRLYAVKVVLPLSTNEEFAQSFGTRHLAGVGITEMSDAFCVIVSEQTGRISFAKDKHIQTDLSIEELFQILSDETKQ